MNIEQKLGSALLQVENPARYVGGEFIFGKKEFCEGNLKCAICFPDMYEIGMSNNAVRIIYDLINRLDNTYCDRVFAVAPDFEALLRKTDTKLFTLENRFPLNELDFLGFSIGYELSATNILQVLDLGGLSLCTKDRKESDPIVIAGGPASTNPLPFSEFVDFVYIGEAENGMKEILEAIRGRRNRSERIEALKAFPFLWYPGKVRAVRALDKNFGTENEQPLLKHYAVPAFQVAQDNGNVEIMRGCPNGCRFCHAGQYYKPMRQRSLETVYSLVRQNVRDFGYREITLSSLSSGDYPNLDKMMSALNNSFAGLNVSFSLPSLKVSSFSLGILEQLSEIRKSGLTFAIETPLLLNQRSMNKEVPIQQIIDIILEAKNRGWKLAKFYFMVGLPFVDIETEQENIISFLSEIRKATKINMNINIGTFIPKAHTPFQWCRQLTMEESETHLRSIKRALTQAIAGIKVSYHEPAVSFIEGLISRGGKECCNLILKAYENGCRMDAWDEKIDFSKWKDAIDSIGYDTSPVSWETSSTLPWDSVTMNVSKAYLIKEYENAKNSVLTASCSEECSHACGVCGKNAAIVQQPESTFIAPSEEQPELGPYKQAVFSYSKTGRAVFCSHISVMRNFEMAFQRCSLKIAFTQGFNPKPKLEFLNPLSLGVAGENELLLCEMPENQITEKTIGKLNQALPIGFTVKTLTKVNSFEKKISLSSKMKGSIFEIADIKEGQILSTLESAMKNSSSDYTIHKTSETSFMVAINGEKNLFKLLFGPDMNKFYIAGSCKITRKEILTESL